jgi:hypothetical protein
MTTCCACCCFYPKYKRKVDNIYPRNYDAPLIKNEVDKLQYYVTVHPEKLSKIGDYLYQNLKWGLNGSDKNRNYVKNTVEAVEKILFVITPQNLNYYAPNCLKIIQKLLEQGGAGAKASGGIPRVVSNGMSNSSSTSRISNANSTTINNNTSESLEYQKMAANLFVKFCEKEATDLSTLNNNLNFDTFVCQFSSMCYNNNKDESVRFEIRSSALQCLSTLVKRLVPDDNLRAGYLWDNMDKIIPALLFIMHETFLNNEELNLNDQIDGDYSNDEIELDRYLYGDFYINSKSNNNIFSSAGTALSDEDKLKASFKKKLTNSNSHINNADTNGKSKSNSGSSTPDEGKIIVYLKCFS